MELGTGDTPWRQIAGKVVLPDVRFSVVVVDIGRTMIELDKATIDNDGQPQPARDDVRGLTRSKLRRTVDDVESLTHQVRRSRSHLCHPDARQLRIPRIPAVADRFAVAHQDQVHAS